MASLGGYYGQTSPTTGYHKVNNIYDMGGNAWEWTTEACNLSGQPYVPRGGSYNHSSSTSAPPAGTRGRSIGTEGHIDFGFRVVLYL